MSIPAIGIFSRTFARPSLEGVLDAIAGHGLSHVHFNLMSAGLASLPDAIEPALCGNIRRAFAARGLVMTSVSATFNAIHPDVRKREADIGRAGRLIERCGQMGTSIATLCTGTRDPESMWRRHANNDRPDAWRDLLATVGRLLPIAESAGVVLGIEPEQNNVVNSAVQARRLLDEVRSPQVRIVLDGANLFDGTRLSRMREVLSEAFELLAEDVILVHTKDVAGPGRDSQAAGRGLLDWSTYFGLLQKYKCEAPVILHGLSEAEVTGSVSFVKEALRAVF